MGWRVGEDGRLFVGIAFELRLSFEFWGNKKQS
jgi:hypothetical protein